MLRAYYCANCQAWLVKTNPMKFPHLEIECLECGHFNTFDYDPDSEVKKDDQPTQPLFNA